MELRRDVRIKKREESYSRTVCELKHKGGYKRMLHRVLQIEAGNTIRHPKQEVIE